MVECSAQLVQLAVAPYKAREPAPSRDLQARAQGSGAQHFVNGNGLGDALDLRLPQGLALEIALDQLVGALTHDHPAPTGQTLHARSQMDRVPDWGVVGVQIIFADRA